MFILKLEFKSGSKAEFTVSTRKQIAERLSFFSSENGYEIVSYTLDPVSTSETQDASSACCCATH